MKDLDDTGTRHEKTQLKSSQEPTTIIVQKAMHELRPNIIHTNNPMGESKCNGRVGNVIRQIQENVRALKHQFERGINETPPDGAPTMAWVARLAAELISKHSLGDGGGNTI